MKVKIESFRNIIDEIEIDLEKNKITTIIGTNGSGKTNILESIHYFVSDYENTDVEVTSNFSSHKEMKERELVDKKRISLSYELLEKPTKDVEKYLKEIKVSLEKNGDKKFLTSRSKTQKGFSIEFDSSLIEIYNELFKSKKETIDSKYYSIDEGGNYWPNIKYIEIALGNKTLQNKQVLQPIFEKIIKIRDIFLDKPTIEFINNATADFDVKHHTNILNLADETLKREVESLLYFIGPDAVIHAQEFLKLNSNQANDSSRMEKIKNKIIKLGNKKIGEIFSFFDLYAKPEISFDNTNLSIATEFETEEILFGDPINQQNNSAGYKSIFHFILKFEYLIEYAAQNNKEVILVVDELDKNLHPMLQSQLLTYIKSRIEKSNIYLIISTHSPFLLEMDKKFSNYYVAYKENDGSLKLSPKNTFDNSGVVSSFLVFAKKVLDSHELLMKMEKPRLIILESNSYDDIKILQAKINKKIENVEFISENSDNTIAEDVKKVIEHPNDLREIENFLEDNKRVFISKNLLEKLRNEE